MKTSIYIDGFNLYQGCLKYTDFKWLNLQALFFDKLVHQQNPSSTLVDIKFFTADIKHKFASNGREAERAQSEYHQALKLTCPNIQIVSGYYSAAKQPALAYVEPPDKKNRVDIWRLEEKQTDVNIALSMYRDVVAKKVRQVVLVGNDSDLIPAFRAIREDFGSGIVLGAIMPIKEGSKDRNPNKGISELSDWVVKKIRDDDLVHNQLPDRVVNRKKGRVIEKPHYW